MTSFRGTEPQRVRFSKCLACSSVASREAVCPMVVCSYTAGLPHILASGVGGEGRVKLCCVVESTWDHQPCCFLSSRHEKKPVLPKLLR